jgi:methyltransferase family protein
VTRIPRQVEAELLDGLPASDPAAIRSRRDLQRLNRWMGQADTIARLLRTHGAARSMRRVVDLGGGDGTLLLQMARELATHCDGVQAVLVDRQALMSDRTREAFKQSGWEIAAVASDVLEWLAGAPRHEGTVMIANLFLHHFEDAPLRALLEHASTRAELFVACEPRRDRLTLQASRLVGWIGCNAVTRHDAPISVRAGFTGRELSALWPAGGDWRTEEGPTGPFSHYFVARRETRAPR